MILKNVNMKSFIISCVLLLPLLGFSQKTETINWMTIEEVQTAMDKEPRKVIIDVYTDWCGWCKRMDKSTFQNETIAQYVNQNFYAVKFNAEQKEAITLDGQAYEFVAQGRRGYHQLAATLLQGKMSYPSIVYLDENLKMIQPIPGYMDAAQFEQIINYFAGNHHKAVGFDDFKKTFESNLNKS